MDVFEAIRKRRSIRNYTGDSIPVEHLEQIVDAGRWAASGYNRQPWVFVVVTDKATLERFCVVSKAVEQAAAVGGQVEINSVLGVGTQVRAYLPLVPSGRQETVPTSASELLFEPLTPREREVLVGVAAGLTNKQIAARLGISDRTVQFHLGNVLGKLGVASRTEAAVLALQRGLV